MTANVLAPTAAKLLVVTVALATAKQQADEKQSRSLLLDV
jgi:hypothetical protein